MSLYLNLLLGHLLGDFVLQPGRLVTAKRRSVAALLAHVTVVSACSAAVLWAELDRYWYVVVYVAIAHFTVEVVTIQARRRRFVRGVFLFTLDQVLHLATLVGPVLLAGGWRDSVDVRTFGAELHPGTLAAVVAMATVIFLGSILVFEAAETADSSPEDGILAFDGARVAGMVERGSALAVALVAGPALLAVPFLPRALLALRLPPRDRLRQMTMAAAGLVLCTMAYAFAAAVAAAGASFGNL